MKQRYPMFAMMLLFVIGSLSAFAQRTVSGRVTDTGGNGMPGVNVIVKGTSAGTSTDATGRYSISVADDATTLVFSFIGYASQEVEVGNRTSVDVSMAEDTQQLSEVVVTALGVERSVKSLQYSMTTVSGENFQEARTNNLANQLAGRVAGVNVSQIAGGPAGSSRVIIRGNKSLLGNNQPLYVVDGIPMDNSGFGQAGIWGGRDQGDGMSSINPDDIESITVLKGANAAALYGARAANGVINIVTKKGTARKGIGIDYVSNYVFEQINDLRDYQTTYGQGSYDRLVRANPDPHIGANPYAPRGPWAPTTQQEGYNWRDSWGPRLGSVPDFVMFDGTVRPYTDQGDNFKRFFETGSSWTNTLSLTGGSATQNFRISFSNLDNKGIIPNSGFKRKNVSLATNSKFGEKVTFVSKVLYSNEYADNRPWLSDSPNNGILSMYYVPLNHNVEWYKGDPNKLGAIPASQDAASLNIWGKSPGEEFQVANNNWHQNPYWVAYQFENDDQRDRIITSGQLRYDVTKWLWVQGRGGMDWYTRRVTDLVPQGTGHTRGGGMNEREYRVREINLEWMMGADKTFGEFSVNAFVGGNSMRRKWEEMHINGSGFSVPFEEFINNSASRTWSFGINESGINSLFGSAQFGYKEIAFITATARKDWFSVLNPESNSILYPSVGGSFVFSDAFSMPSFISFGKLRASWAQVGSAQISPYNINLTYSLNGNTHNGYTLASFSTAGGNNGTIPNPDLKPMTSTEIEFGVDMRFLQDRLGLDLTYYHQRTTDDILNATISKASGFGSKSVNVGELENKGIELLLRGTPVVGPLTWEVSLNLAKNNNKVISLIEGNNELIIEEPRSRNAFIKHVVGHPFGVITGRVQDYSPDGDPLLHNGGFVYEYGPDGKVLKELDNLGREVDVVALDANGRPIVKADGRPVQQGTLQILGNGVPDLTGGLMNSLSFKNFNMSFLVDFKFGGDILSGTNMRLTAAGLSKMSLQGREGEDPLNIDGVVKVPVLDLDDRDNDNNRFENVSTTSDLDDLDGDGNTLETLGSLDPSVLGDIALNEYRPFTETVYVSDGQYVGDDAQGNPVFIPLHSANTGTLTPDQARNYWGAVQGETNAKTDLFLYDASFVKLRQVTIGYTFPRAILSKTPFQNVSLSFVARNLAILYKNIPNIDPESSYQNGNGQGLDYFGFPATRSYGFDLKVQF